MQIKDYGVPVCDAFVCELARHNDHRGYFEELYSQKVLSQFECLQINCSRSRKNVLRGLHVVPFAKLVHCVMGKIYDVVADMRKESKSYLQWYGIELSEENQLSLYIPPHCAHGFLALEDSIVMYAQDGLYDPRLERSINFADPTFGIKWPVSGYLILSEKDAQAGQ